MATQVWTNCKVWFCQYDVSGVMNAVALNIGLDLVENTTFGNTFKTRLPSLGSADIQCDGYLDIGAGKIDDYGTSLMGTGGPLSVVPTAGVEGDLAYFFNALESDFKLFGNQVGEMAKFSLSAQSQNKNGAIRGNLLALKTGQAVTGTSAVQNLGAIASGKSLHAALHVLAASGTTPSLTVKVQSAAASGFATPHDQITFSAATAAGSQYATPVAGPNTDAYWRTSFTISGTSPSFDFLVVMGIK